MDDKLMQIFKANSGSSDVAEFDMAVHDGWIEIASPEGPVRHDLKPLRELYGCGVGARVDPKDERFMPLFLGIEEQMLECYRRQLSLTDGAVRLAYNRLAQSPESDVSDDPLAHAIQNSLRLILSLNDYSRDELRGVLRRLVRSVEMHNSHAGTRGYLDFITTMFSHGRKAVAMPDMDN